MNYNLINSKIRYILIAVLLVLFCSAERPIPRILIIGDSISIGYTPFVKKALSDIAIVVHNEGNAQYTGYGLNKINKWLGNEHWDVIQFNFGLWDLCYRNNESKAQGKRDKINGKITTSSEEYRENLETLVRILQKTHAKLIFVTTTVVPENEVGRFPCDVDKYNAVALEVMKKYHITVNDLNPLSHKVHQMYGLGNDNVHYTVKGYEILSIQITNKIKKLLSL